VAASHTQKGNKMTIIENAINESIANDCIVHLDHTPELADELQSICDDSVDNDGVIEYWGVDDDGRDWRIHLDY